jgi:hypothetical protein
MRALAAWNASLFTSMGDEKDAVTSATTAVARIDARKSTGTGR